MMKSSRHSQLKWRMKDRRIQICACLAILFAMLLLVQRHKYCWEAKPMMEDMLPRLSGALEESPIQGKWWLAYGTLLGVVRDRSLMPHEYDLDIAMTEETCLLLEESKPYFKKRGFTVYTRDDKLDFAIPFTWDTRDSQFAWRHPYLTLPCGRAYDRSGYFVDIYGFQDVPGADVLSMARNGSFILYPRLKENGSPAPGVQAIKAGEVSQVPDVMCNAEGLKEHSSLSGGCQLRSVVFPLQKHVFMGTTTYIPNHTEVYLAESYGDDWKTPVLKGMRAPLCYFQF